MSVINTQKSMSRYHEDSPFVVSIDGVRHASSLTWLLFGFVAGGFGVWLWFASHNMLCLN